MKPIYTGYVKIDGDLQLQTVKSFDTYGECADWLDSLIPIYGETTEGSIDYVVNRELCYTT